MERALAIRMLKSSILEGLDQEEDLEDYLKRNNLHYCQYKLAHEAREALCQKTLRYKTYGAAITERWEDKDGYFHVSNDEYCSLVNFCPFCGYKSKMA